ncbi:MFS transporter [Chloroflexota bacterium]|nr:MFS transporter [Chloroflexota bacterium]
MSIKPLKLKFDLFVFTLTRTVINTSYRMVYPFLPVFARGLGVEPASLGLALSIRSFLGIFGPFLATVADTRNRKTGFLLGIGLFVAGSGLVGLSPSFVTFIIGISLTLLGNVVFIPSLSAYLGDHVPYERRGRVLAITELSWALAFIGGIPVVRWLIESYMWFTPFIFFAIIGVVLFIVVLITVPGERIDHSTENTFWRNLGRILRTWPALAGLLAGVLFAMANELVNLVFGLWIEQGFGLDFAALTIASVVIGVSELGGEVFTGIWLDAIGKRRMIWIFLGLNALAAALLPFLGGRLNLAMVGLGFFYITFEILLVSALTLMSEVMPSTRATMLSATLASYSIGRMMGDLIGPTLFNIGFWATCLAAVLLNVAAAGLMTRVRLNVEE